MTEPRQRLEGIARRLMSEEKFYAPAMFAARFVDAILEDGWQPPPRRVHTVEELDALPVGAVVMDSPYPEGDVYQRTPDGFWAEPGFEGLFTTRVLCPPVVVLCAAEEES